MKLSVMVRLGSLGQEKASFHSVTKIAWLLVAKLPKVVSQAVVLSARLPLTTYP